MHSGSRELVVCSLQRVSRLCEVRAASCHNAMVPCHPADGRDAPSSCSERLPFPDRCVCRPAQGQANHRPRAAPRWGGSVWGRLSRPHHPEKDTADDATAESGPVSLSRPVTVFSLASPRYPICHTSTRLSIREGMLHHSKSAVYTPQSPTHAAA